MKNIMEQLTGRAGSACILAVLLASGAAKAKDRALTVEDVLGGDDRWRPE